MSEFSLRLVLVSLFLTYCSGAVIHSDDVAANTEISLSPHPILIVVSYDGFRHDYFDNTEKTPWLNALKRGGVSVPYMDPVFPTFTFPNHQSIATGLYAETHGITGNTLFDPLYNSTLSGFRDDPGFWNYHPGVLPIWLRNEMAGEGRVSGCFMWPGSSQPYGPNNDLLPTYSLDYNGSVPWENRVDTVISWITDDTKPANLVFMYYDEPDSTGHAYGPNSQETLSQVDQADNRTAYLVNKLIEAGIFNKVNLILTSDHGMAEVTDERIIYLNTMIDNDLLEAKYGGTPVVQLKAKEGRVDELYEKLTEFSLNSDFTVWKKEDLRNPFYFNTSRRISDLVVVANPGYAFDDYAAATQVFKDRLNIPAEPTRVFGVHGYSNMAPEMKPFFIAHGPVFKQGLEHPPIKNVDLVPLMSKILGIPEAPNNGTLTNVEGMIEPTLLL